MASTKKFTLSNDLLDDIEMAMNENTYEMEWYLDTHESKVTFLCDAAVTAEYEQNERLERLIEEDEEGRFIPIPATSSHEDWHQMEQFILSLDEVDDTTQDSLLDTIQGKGAFGRFKNALYDIGIQDQWFEFKNRDDRQQALDWLRFEGLITAEQLTEGLQMYEERLRKKKRRELVIINMNEGKVVKCRDNSGHADKITVGKTYEVRDEQKEHLNIRLQDDRGKLVWLPKSHFQLVGMEEKN